LANHSRRAAAPAWRPSGPEYFPPATGANRGRITPPPERIHLLSLPPKIYRELIMTEEKSPSVLIVEDDLLFQGVYRTQLEKQGFQVKVISNGEAAWREIEASPPDIILLDLVLPGLSGHDILTRLKADPRLAEVPVIILTSRGEPADIERGKQEGAADYLIKGVINPKEVIWKIRQALAKKTGEPLPLRVALQEKLLDAPMLAETAKGIKTLKCPQCNKGLLLELTPKPDRPGWFDARLICPDCGK